MRVISVLSKVTVVVLIAVALVVQYGMTIGQSSSFGQS